MIPDAAVEAAAKAYRAKVEWIDRHSRDDYGREDELGMRAALEAAAPHMLAVTEEAFGYAVSAIRGHGEFTTAEAEAAVGDIINALGVAK